MGRVKLKIQKLESLSSRQVTFGKRKTGILKKAQEISVLCDIEIILLMFSPTGKPSIFRGERSNLDEMIAKYAQLTPKERAKRRLESLETLKRNFKKLDQDVDIEDFLETSAPSAEDMQNRVRMLQDELGELHQKLILWRNPNKIENIDQLNQMENSIRQSLDTINMLKQEKSSKQPDVPFDCTNQFQNGINIPISTTSGQDWLQGDDDQPLMIPNKSHFVPAGDMECTRDTLFPSCSSFFGDVKEQVPENSRHIIGERLDGISVDDYACSSHHRLPLCEQYSQYHLSFPDVVIDPVRGVNFHTNHVDPYQMNGNFELQRSLYSTIQHGFVPAVGTCGISILNQNPFPQPPNH